MQIQVPEEYRRWLLSLYAARAVGGIACVALAAWSMGSAAGASVVVGGIGVALGNMLRAAMSSSGPWYYYVRDGDLYLSRGGNSTAGGRLLVSARFAHARGVEMGRWRSHPSLVFTLGHGKRQEVVFRTEDEDKVMNSLLPMLARVSGRD